MKIVHVYLWSIVLIAPALHAKSGWGPFAGGLGVGVIGSQIFSGNNCRPQQVIQREVVTQPVIYTQPAPQQQQDVNVARRLHDLEIKLQNQEQTIAEQKNDFRKLKRSYADLEEQLEEKTDEIQELKKKNKDLQNKIKQKTAQEDSLFGERSENLTATRTTAKLQDNDKE